MNDNQSFLGGMGPVNNGVVPNNNINDGSVIPGAGLMPVGGPSGTPTTAPAPASVGTAEPTPVVPTPILSNNEAVSVSPALPGIVDAPDNGIGGMPATPTVPGIVDAANVASVPASPAPVEPVGPSMGVGIMDGSVATNMPVQNNDVLGGEINNAPIMVDNNVNSGPDLMASSASPFDIGLGPATVNPSMNNNSIMPNGGANIVSNSADNKPFTNETANSNVEGEEVVSVGTYILNMILFCVPVIGFILILVKAFSKKTNKNVSNFAKAYLIMQFIIVLLAVGLMFLVVSLYGSDALTQMSAA